MAVPYLLEGQRYFSDRCACPRRIDGRGQEVALICQSNGREPVECLLPFRGITLLSQAIELLDLE
jgi:hypothetical protein